MIPFRSLAFRALAVSLLIAGACNSGTTDPGATPVTDTPTTTTTTIPQTTTIRRTTTTTEPPPPPPPTTATLQGQVLASTGAPLSDALVFAGDKTGTSDAGGLFVINDAPFGTVVIERPGWIGTEIEWDGGDEVIELDPLIVRALRVSSSAAGNTEQFTRLLDLADETAVNALVFDTKSESGRVHYPTRVVEAYDIGAAFDSYDPTTVLAAAHERGLYAITRIVTFEDPIRSKARKDLKLFGQWVDPRNRETWAYPLELAEEACEIGFDEIQFDYVRFPAGRSASAAKYRSETTAESRLATVTEFLTEARSVLHPLGCALSADIFAIVLSTPDEQGIGQRPEELSVPVDAISPMIYPSHYSDGWLGFAKPNDHPAAVVADALDDGTPRLAATTLMRPWLQSFYYNASQVKAGIDEAEERGVGWMLWNAASNFLPASLPEPPPPADVEDDDVEPSP